MNVVFVARASTPETLAKAVTDLNRQAQDRGATQWRIAAVVDDRSSMLTEEHRWCAFLEAERDEPVR